MIIIKKLILVFAVGGFFTQAQAQKMMEKNVPTSVTSAFKKEYPSVKDIDWSKDGNNYEAQYDSKTGDKSVTYDAAGNLLETEMNIKSSSLPAPVMAYVKKNYKEDEVKEASKITDTKGIVTYEAEVKGLDLIFDANGNFIKSQKK